MKKLRHSRTAWVNTLAVLAVQFPPIASLLREYPDWGVFTLACLNVLMRWKTDQAIEPFKPFKGFGGIGR